MKELGINYDRIVDERDIQNISESDSWVKEAARRAENCGCLNCKKEHKSAVIAHHDYLMTIRKAPIMDHEEKALMTLALSFVGEDT